MNVAYGYKRAAGFSPRLTFDSLSLTLIDSDLPAGGAVAQLGERLNGIQEVVGSTPIGSTNSTHCKKFLFPAVFFYRRRSTVFLLSSLWADFFAKFVLKGRDRRSPFCYRL
jgi:hypothetical protein